MNIRPSGGDGVPAEPQGATVSTGGDAGSVVVLIVDDEECVIDALARTLGHSGFRVLSTTDPLAVMGILSTERVDIVISDLRMPGGDGVDLLARLRRSHPEIVRILLTGSASLEAAQRAINEGEVFRFLSKPYNSRELRIIMEEAAIRGAQLRDLRQRTEQATRRKALLADLEARFPGITPSPSADRIYSLEDGRLADVANSEHHPVRLADLLLAEAAQPSTASVVIERGDGEDVRLISVSQTGVADLVIVPELVGRAIASRILLLAGLDLAAPTERLGTLSVRVNERRTDMVVLVAHRKAQLQLEIRPLWMPVSATLEASPQDRRRFGSYVVDRMIGEGGQATVFEGRHELLGKPVAIKVLKGRLAADRRRSTLLLREGRMAGRAHHPGVVDVTDYGVTEDGHTFLVMELVPWPTLEAVLVDGALPPPRALAIGKQILLALESAHHQDVVHRDLKPANIFVSPHDLIKIGDFGSARAPDVEDAGPGAGGSRFAWGTPRYMAPEQFRGSAVDRRADLYAFGCLFFEMVAGGPPFPGEGAEVMEGHLKAAIPRVMSPWCRLPAPFQKLIDATLAKDPHERVSSAAEVIRHIDACAHALRSTAVP
ncbi:MAG: protein kinase [Myxococcales bacterium]